MRKEARVTGLVREELPEYPPFAVREAIINAMAHRDWRVSGVGNQVRMFDDRLQMEIDEDEGVLYGRVLNVARDGVTFSGRTVAEAKEDFTRAVEDYPRAVRPGRP